MPFAIGELLTGLVKPITDLIGDMHTSVEEKGRLQLALGQIQVSYASQVLDYELKIQQMQADVIKAEAQGGSWLQRSWRPITMLTFVALIVARWLGLSDVSIPVELEVELFSIVKLGLGGYVVGRSVEKVAPSIATAISDLRIGKNKN